MDITAYIVIFSVFGVMVLAGLVAWYLSRRDKNYARCWRCGKTLKKEQLIWLKTAGDWTCSDCDEIIKMYIDIQ